MSGKALNPESVLITGANRGIGLELVTQFVLKPSPPNLVFAIVRNKEKCEALKKIAEEAEGKSVTVVILQLELTDYAGYSAVVDEIGRRLEGRGLNLVVHNAGVVQRENSKFGEVTPQHMMWEFENNTVTIMMLSQALAPLVRDAAKRTEGAGMSCSRAAFVALASNRASLNDPGGSRYPYRASKVAVQMIMKTMAVDLKDEGILCASLHPGHLKTDMGGPLAQTPVEDGVRGILEVMASLTEEETGSFYDYKGNKYSC